jgi:hypothetical protein
MAAASQPRSQEFAGQRSAGVRADKAASVPRQAFRAALLRYKGTRLAAIRQAQGANVHAGLIRPAEKADEIAEHLDGPSAVDRLLARLPAGSRLALSLVGLTERTTVPLAALAHALRMLGMQSEAAIMGLLEFGLVALDLGPQHGLIDQLPVALESGRIEAARLRIHPSVLRAMKTVRPSSALPTATDAVSQIREADGLEPILRLGALWQRVRGEPLRQTLDGKLYKRDRDRLGGDPVLAGPIADTLQPLPDPYALWLGLAWEIGLIQRDSGGDQVHAAAPEFWSDNSVHLPQMIATGWIGLQTWGEREGLLPESIAEIPPMPYLRAAVLLSLSTLGDSEWVALDDLAAHFSALDREWEKLSVSAPEVVPTGSAAARRGKMPPGKAKPRSQPDGASPGFAVLESLLLAAAYPLGLVRAAEAGSLRRRVVQLTPLGRYVLALGKTPPPRAQFDKFLFVQPNFEVVAFRQGLTPQLIGRLSSFAWWTQLGAALELKLTRESIVLGLDCGSTPESMLATLTQHSQRPLPPGVIDAVETWAVRRERVTYYAAATLIEFGSAADRDTALEYWPADQAAAPLPVAERFLLVQDEHTVPFDRLRKTSSRDYRRPPEVCVIVEEGGVTLALDPARADLLVDAELARFADPLPTPEPARGQTPTPPLRRFLISPSSLRRGMTRGMALPQLSDWFARRTDSDLPPALRLLLMARSSRPPSIKAARLRVVTAQSPELLDGLFQHPATSSLLGDRLGPLSVTIAENNVVALAAALKDLGIHLELD